MQDITIAGAMNYDGLLESSHYMLYGTVSAFELICMLKQILFIPKFHKSNH
jgi:hypothetical protein